MHRNLTIFIICYCLLSGCSNSCTDSGLSSYKSQAPQKESLKSIENNASETASSVASPKQKSADGKMKALHKNSPVIRQMVHTLEVLDILEQNMNDCEKAKQELNAYFDGNYDEMTILNRAIFKTRDGISMSQKEAMLFAEKIKEMTGMAKEKQQYFNQFKEKCSRQYESIKEKLKVLSNQ